MVPGVRQLYLSLRDMTAPYQDSRLMFKTMLELFALGDPGKQLLSPSRATYNIQFDKRISVFSE